ncbi:MAG: hypothetical protein FRX48_06843 [Lasallia pustulata]|uniref:CCHC-type domain-containing protein n=1 Tax=Lasallia pustulata TaxID=136370 RepID=A0A5M8PJW1_9LECA|nr:MAG: hypothetical protein FRX48_06843 [Lasallia pustulata]
MLDTVMRAFTRGIQDADIKRDTLRGLVTAGQSLLGLYTIAEECRRAKVEYLRLQEEVARAQELQFYREVVQRNMPTVQIDSLRASFQALSMPSWGYSGQVSQPQPIAWSTQAPTYPMPVPAPAQYYPQYPPRLPTPVQRPAYQPPATARPPLGQLPNFNPNPALMARSANRFLNSSVAFTPCCGIFMCIRCEEEGHLSRNCGGQALSRSEQNVLRTLVPGDRERLMDNSVAGPLTPAITNTVLRPPPPPVSVGVHSITYGTKGLHLASSTVGSTEAFLSEGSGPNKRPHLDEPTSSPVPTSSRPTVNPGAFRPGAPVSQGFFFQGMPTVQNENERPKKKGQKRIEKAATIAPLVSLMDEDTGLMDKPTSVRQLLKSQKIDMTWMDFCVWSPTVCRELKRLLTRMSNRKKKGKSASGPVQPGAVNSIAVDGNTRFLNTFMGADKAFQIPCKVRVDGSREIALDRSQVQAD